MKKTEDKVATPSAKYPFLVKENVRILLEAYRDVHRRMFSFSWRRIFPFSLYYHRIDYTAYARFLKEISQKLKEQQEACNHPSTPLETEEEKKFLLSLGLYANLLQRSTEHLREIALQILDRTAWSEVKEELNRYHESCSQYTRQAKELNEKYIEMNRADQERAENNSV